MSSWTARQKEIMGLVLAGDGGDAWLDIDQLCDRVSGGSTKQALQLSLRILERHGVLVRHYRTKRSRRRMILVPTVSAYGEFAARK